jgi:hypothetical protein
MPQRTHCNLRHRRQERSGIGRGETENALSHSGYALNRDRTPSPPLPVPVSLHMPVPTAGYMCAVGEGRGGRTRSGEVGAQTLHLLTSIYKHGYPKPGAYALASGPVSSPRTGYTCPSRSSARWIHRELRRQPRCAAPAFLIVQDVQQVSQVHQ